MKLIIKNGQVIDPANSLDDRVDILVERGRIRGIAPNLEEEGAAIIDASDRIVTPGLIDMHVHLREPGRQQYKETIRTGSRAAAHGGFTTVVCEPNPDPPIDTEKRVRYVLEVAKNESLVNVYTKACITKGLRGKRVVNVAGVVKAGAVGITDDGFPVFDMQVMLEAAREAKRQRIPICPHCEESRLGRNRDGLAFEVHKSEALYIQQYVVHVVEDTGCAFHFQHVSLAESVDRIREAKMAGLPVTAEVTPHHLTLTEADYKRIGPNAKVNPPIRTAHDVRAVQRALKADIIDVIASDHAPHAPFEKEGPNPPFGIIGLETTLGVVLTRLVEPGLLSLASAIRKMTCEPARILNLRRGHLAPGMPADITVIDPTREWTVDASKFESMARNCPFDGWKLRGKATMTIVAGKVAMCEDRVFDPPAEDPRLWHPALSAQMVLPI